MSSSLLYDTIEEKLDDYRPPHVRAADRMIEYFRQEFPPQDTGHLPGRSRGPETQVSDLPAAPPIRIDPLEEMARIARSLTYGQMIELASGLGLPPMTIHRWAKAMPGL